MASSGRLLGNGGRYTRARRVRPDALSVLGKVVQSVRLTTTQMGVADDSGGSEGLHQHPGVSIIGVQSRGQ